MHGEIKIFDAIIMFAQKPEGISERTCGMFNYVENVRKVYKKAIDQKASSLMPPGQQECGYTAGFEDPICKPMVDCPAVKAKNKINFYICYKQ